MYTKNLCLDILKFVMDIYSPLLWISLFGFLCGLTDTRKRKHRRLAELQDRVYVPSLINFELKGKSLHLNKKILNEKARRRRENVAIRAWLPVKLSGGDVQLVKEQSKKLKHRKCRGIEEIYIEDDKNFPEINNRKEDDETGNAGKTDIADKIPEADSDDEYETEDEQTTMAVKAIHILQGSNFDNETSFAGRPLLFHLTTEFPLTDDTEVEAYSVRFPTTKIHVGNPAYPDQKHTYSIPTVNSITMVPNPTLIIDSTTHSVDDDASTGDNETSDELYEEYEDTSTDKSSTNEDNTDKGVETSTDRSTSESTTAHTTHTKKSRHTTTEYTIEVHPSSAITKHKSTHHHSHHTTPRHSTSGHHKSSTRFPNKWFYNPFIKDDEFITTETTVDAGYEDEYEDDYEEYEGDNDMCEDEAVEIEKENLTSTTQFIHIETYSFSRRPLNLRFPTCPEGEDSLEIKIHTFKHPRVTTSGTNGTTGSTETTASTNETTAGTSETTGSTNGTTSGTTERKKKRRKHHTETTTLHSSVKPHRKHSKPKSKYTGTGTNDAKVLVRIPPSLSELPVVVFKDKEAQMLSLSLVSGDQDQTEPKPPLFPPPLLPIYQQMIPPQFPYPNNLYLPNYPPVKKVHPHGYIYRPHGIQSKPISGQKHHGFFNNLRWIRGTYYEEDENGNSTNSKYKLMVNA